MPAGAYAACRRGPGVIAMLVSLAALTAPAHAQGGSFSLSYAPRASGGALQYPLRLGVLDARDGRTMPFHLQSDAALREPVSQALADMVFVELKASGLFAEVRRIREPAPQGADQAALVALRQKHGVDLLMLTDVTDLNMRREKEDMPTVHDFRRITPEFKVIVEAGWVGRLIYPDQGVVVWGDAVSGKAVELAPTGTLAVDRIGALTRQAVASGMNDMRMLMTRFGKRMAP
ncbi:MAG: hypothetical protein AB7P37_19310 [Ramlibacter sp.]